MTDDPRRPCACGHSIWIHSNIDPGPCDMPECACTEYREAASHEPATTETSTDNGGDHQ